MANEQEQKPTSERDKLVAKMERRKARSKKLVSNMIVMTIIITLLAMGLTALGFVWAFVYFLVAMLPGVVAYMTDIRPGKYASKSIMAFNMAGTFPFLGNIMFSPTPSVTATATLGDVQAWLMAYGFAAFGWGAIYILPHITQIYLEVKASFTVAKLTYVQERLVEEWGDDVKRLV